MLKVLIAYATHEGHTQLIAQHLAETLSRLGAGVTTWNVAEGAVDVLPFDRIVVASPVHLGRHERAMVSFVKAHRDALTEKHAVFISVGGATAAAQQGQPPEKRAQYAADAKLAVEQFFKTTGWTASHVEYVAGAVLFRQYNWLVRFIMKRIAASEGLSTDTSKDHDYTNWAALDRFAVDLVSDTPELR